MSSKQNTANGAETPPIASDVRTVTHALRELVVSSEQVTLAQLAQATSLEPAAVETAMGQIERVTPLTAKRVGGSGDHVTWEIAL